MDNKLAAKIFNPPHSTLATCSQKVMERFKQVFPIEMGTLLKEHIIDMEAPLFCLTLWRLAFQPAEKKNIQHYFNIEVKMVGED